MNLASKAELIVNAAIEVIREDGLGAFTQPRVATRVGMRQSHLTYYFPTRDDLLVAVARQVVRDRIAALSAANAAGDGAARIAAIAKVLADPAETRLLLALIQSADGNDEVRAAFADLRTGIDPFSADLARLYGDEPTPELVQLIQIASIGMAVLSLANGGVEFEERTRRLLTFILARG